VYSGQVRIVGEPTNPVGSAQTMAVEVAPLSRVVARLRRDDRDDLAELYLLASELAR